MRPAPLPMIEEDLEPAGAMVGLTAPSAGSERTPSVARLPVRAVLGLAAALGLLLTGVAAGSWLTGGPTVQTVAVPGARPVALGPAEVGAASPVYPGGASDLSVPVSNPNPFAVRVISADIQSEACSHPALHLAHPLVIPPSLVRARVLTYAGAVQMGSLASNDCQGQVLVVTFTQLRAAR